MSHAVSIETSGVIQALSFCCVVSTETIGVIQALSLPVRYCKSFPQIPKDDELYFRSRLLLAVYTQSTSEDQQELLHSQPPLTSIAHPNVKLFIMQGGLQSLNEAALRAIPLIGIPFFSDQEHNCGKIVSGGLGLRLRYRDITKEAVLQAVRTVLEDNTYAENMKQYSKLFREHWETSLDKAVWWLEYMIRHRGAPHMRSAALDLHWWQLLLLDVIAFLLVVAAAAVAAVYFMLRCTVAFIFRSKGDKVKTQ